MITETVEHYAVTEESFFLDPDIKGPRAQEFEEKLAARIVGQELAVSRMSNTFQTFLAGMNPIHRPVGTMLFLGPTGTGKTRVVEAAAEAIFGDMDAVIKIDCAEFQHSHEIAKLIGSPPGYLGHRETSPLLTQENLDRCHTYENDITFVLFDEIEKASDALWQLLLGILDKATLTLGDNRKVDFSKTIVVMTSNLGAREMSELISGGIGFAPSQGSHEINDAALDKKIYRTAVEAARRKFSPEFMNRIDKVVVFRPLKAHHMHQILELELQAVQDRIMRSASVMFTFHCSDTAKEMLLREGFDQRYGARHLKRSVERSLVFPLSNLVATGQVEFGDSVYVDTRGGKIVFSKNSGGALFGPPQEEDSKAEKLAAAANAEALPVTHGSVTEKRSAWRRKSSSGN
jgi:ATP-dependent Clp protease ATP-binding subunit ClpB